MNSEITPLDKFVSKFKKWLIVEDTCEDETSSDSDARHIYSSEDEQNNRRRHEGKGILMNMAKEESAERSSTRSKSRENTKRKDLKRNQTKENNGLIREDFNKTKAADILKNHKIRITNEPNDIDDLQLETNINRQENNIKYEYFYKNNTRIKLPRTLVQKLTKSELDDVLEELSKHKKNEETSQNNPSKEKEKNSRMNQIKPIEEGLKLKKLRELKENVKKSQSKDLFKDDYFNEMTHTERLHNTARQFKGKENKFNLNIFPKNNDIIDKLVKETQVKQIKDPRIILRQNPEQILKIHDFKAKHKRKYSIESSSSEESKSESSNDEGCDKVKIKLKRRHPKSLDIIHDCTKDLYYNYTDNNVPGTSKLKTRTELINEYLNSITNDLVDSSKEAAVPKDPLTRPALGSSGMYPTKKWIAELKSRGITPIPGKHYKIVKKKANNKTVLNDFWKSKKK